MGLRYRRSIKILPGIRLNFSKSGTSVTVGRRGACVNFSSRGTRTTIGIPGTGISYTSYSRKSRDHKVFGNAVYTPVQREFEWLYVIPMIGGAISTAFLLKGQYIIALICYAIALFVLAPSAVMLVLKKRYANSDKAVSQDPLEPEYQCRMRLFKEGNMTISETVDFDIFEKWTISLLNTINWCYDKYEAQTNISLKATKEQAISKLMIDINNNAVRIAKYISSSDIEKDKAYIRKLRHIRKSLKNAPNKEESVSAINALMPAFEISESQNNQ